MDVQIITCNDTTSVESCWKIFRVLVNFFAKQLAFKRFVYSQNRRNGLPCISRRVATQAFKHTRNFQITLPPSLGRKLSGF